MRQAEDDAGEARHLQETLKRMYREHKDPNFELAIGRAEGIAAHYARKEEALNQRQSEEDQDNIPKTQNEWAESLGRRKVTKPSTRTQSRSRSRENKKNAQKKSQNKPNPKQNNKKGNQQASGPQPSTKRGPQQQQSNQPWKKQGRASSSYTGPRSSASNTSTSSRQHPINAMYNLDQPMGRSTDQQYGPPPSTGYQSTNLNAEEQRLITLLRASKNT